MKRINVSEAFRLSKTNCGFKMVFTDEIDMHKAYEAMEVAVLTAADKNGFYELWLQDLRDSCTSNSFDIHSTLESEEFVNYVPVMCKAVAEAFPSVEFAVTAWYDDLRCYWVDEFEASYKNHLLAITESFADDDHGYFCPECGAWILRVNEGEYYEDDEEIDCEDCEEVFKFSELKFVPPTVTTYEYKI